MKNLSVKPLFLSLTLFYSHEIYSAAAAAAVNNLPRYEELFLQNKENNKQAQPQVFYSEAMQLVWAMEESLREQDSVIEIDKLLALLCEPQAAAAVEKKVEPKFPAESLYRVRLKYPQLYPLVRAMYYPDGYFDKDGKKKI